MFEDEIKNAKNSLPEAPAFLKTKIKQTLFKNQQKKSPFLCIKYLKFSSLIIMALVLISIVIVGSINKKNIPTDLPNDKINDQYPIYNFSGEIISTTIPIQDQVVNDPSSIEKDESVPQKNNEDRQSTKLSLSTYGFSSVFFTLETETTASLFFYEETLDIYLTMSDVSYEQIDLLIYFKFKDKNLFALDISNIKTILPLSNIKTITEVRVINDTFQGFYNNNWVALTSEYINNLPKEIFIQGE